MRCRTAGLVTVAALVSVGAPAFGFQKITTIQPVEGLSEPPERAVLTTAIPFRESDVALRLKVPFETLRTRLEGSVPTEHQSPDLDGGDVCGELPMGLIRPKICVGTRYQFRAWRSPFTLARNGDAVRVSTHVAVDGNGGFKGDGAKLLGLHAKAFRAAANLYADVRLAIDADWCPRVDLEPSYSWTDPPKVEIVSGLWVDIEGAVRGAFDEGLKRLVNEVRHAIPCESVRGELAKVWKTHSVQLPLVEGALVHVVIRPRGLAVSPVVVADDHLRLSVVLRAEASAGSEPPNVEPPGPLPNAEGVSDSPGRLRVTLPIRLGWEALRAGLMRHLAERDTEIVVDGHAVRGRIVAVEVAPQGGSLLVGLDFVAEISAPLVQGWSGRVWLTATPEVDPSGQTVVLRDPEVRIAIEHPLYRFFAPLFEKIAREFVAERAVVDLSAQLQEAARTLDEGLSDPSRTGGIRFRLDRPELRLAGVIPEEDGNLVVAEFVSGLEAELTIHTR